MQQNCEPENLDLAGDTPAEQRQEAAAAEEEEGQGEEQVVQVEVVEEEAVIPISGPAGDRDSVSSQTSADAEHCSSEVRPRLGSSHPVAISGSIP